MKKSLVILSIIFLLLPITVTAQSFDALWQQVNQAEQKDLPKTQIRESLWANIGCKSVSIKVTNRDCTRLC